MGMSWTHEEGSITMLDHLIKVNKINLATYGLDPVADLAIIKEMILVRTRLLLIYSFLPFLFFPFFYSS